MFINYTNHSSSKWSQEQLQAAYEYGDIIDIAFPAVGSTAAGEDIFRLAEEEVKKILEYKPKAVLCQGEFTLCYAVINLLKRENIKVFAACSEREVAEKVAADGTTQKTAVFRFVQFREYIENI